MQSCSIHHCVLFFLTLTFTTASTMDLTSVMVKLNQSALLPCKQNCFGSLKWTVIEKPGIIVAQCNHTSCWSEERFNISHDQYLKGNLSLTVTEADYSNRGLYMCHCNGSDINTVRLSIELRTLYKHLKPGDSLVLDLHMPGHMEVTYKSKNSADPYGEPICSVTQHSVHCKAEYTPRVSLRDADLILEKVKTSDSGVYTIWDKKNQEINLNYIVSVKGPLVNTVKVRLLGSVTLPCTRNCSGLVKWIHRDEVVAQCNETSCHSNEGYEMSHDQQHRNDFSLTVTANYYCVRGFYVCMCNDKGIIDHHVIIEPTNSSDQLKPGEDLLMKLPITEEVEVIYNGSMIYSNNPADKQMCKHAYTHRLLHILKLEKVSVNDSGLYTIQDMNDKEVLLIYNVSVKEDHLALAVGLPLGIIVPLVLFGTVGYKCHRSRNQGQYTRSENTMQ